MEEKSKYKLPWTTFESYCLNVICAVQRSAPHIDCIVAIARGGLVPAAIIANALNIRDVRSIAVSSYSGDTRVAEPRLEVDSGTRFVLNSRSVLFVDDIVDSGKTYELFEHSFPAAYFASTVVRHSSSSFPDFYGHCFKTSDWIVFPWEQL